MYDGGSFFYIKCQLWLEKSSSHSLTHSPINVTFRKSRKHWTSLNSSYASDILALPSHSLLTSWYPFFYLFEYLFQKYWFNSRSRKVIGRRKGKTKQKHTKVVLDRILARIHWHVSGPTDVGLIWERELWERRGWLCGFILLVRRGTKWPL